MRRAPALAALALTWVAAAGPPALREASAADRRGGLQRGIDAIVDAPRFAHA